MARDTTRPPPMGEQRREFDSSSETELVSLSTLTSSLAATVDLGSGLRVGLRGLPDLLQRLLHGLPGTGEPVGQYGPVLWRVVGS